MQQSGPKRPPGGCEWRCPSGWLAGGWETEQPPVEAGAEEVGGGWSGTSGAPNALV